MIGLADSTRDLIGLVLFEFCWIQSKLAVSKCLSVLSVARSIPGELRCL